MEKYSIKDGYSNKMKVFLKKIGKKLVCFKNYCYLCHEFH